MSSIRCEKRWSTFLENLQRTIDLDAGFRDTAKTDADFDSIRRDKQFQALVGQ
ncbi:MAG: TPR end-of-group domain-containing protein [Microcoleaceae cyanobacterium]